MRATKERAARLHAMADDAAPAMAALRRQRVNCAFKAIEIMRNAVHHDFDRFVVFVAATFARRPPMAIRAPQARLFRLSVIAKIPA